MTRNGTRDAGEERGESPYCSFLIRCWGLTDGTWRLKVEHIQSDAWIRVETFAEAVGWVETCAGRGPPERDDELEVQVQKTSGAEEGDRDVHS
jgi:hypothetical protein